MTGHQGWGWRGDAGWGQLHSNQCVGLVELFSIREFTSTLAEHVMMFLHISIVLFALNIFWFVLKKAKNQNPSCAYFIDNDVERPCSINSVIKVALPERGLSRATSGVYGEPCFFSSFKKAGAHFFTAA